MTTTTRAKVVHIVEDAPATLASTGKTVRATTVTVTMNALTAVAKWHVNASATSNAQNAVKYMNPFVKAMTSNETYYPHTSTENPKRS